VVSNHGLDVLWARDAQEMIASITNCPPSTLVIDLSEVSPQGLTGLRRVLLTRPGIPAVILVEDIQRQEALDAHRMGAFAVLRKPLHDEELAYHLGNALTTSAEQYDASRVRIEDRSLILHNDFSLVTPVAKSLVDTTLPPSDSRRTQVTLGLIEILNNAIEHGNLGITYEEKKEALRSSVFFDLARHRCQQSPWKERVVSIRCQVRPSEGLVRYIVQDEGIGFNWRSLPDPKDVLNISARHGRGILMARHSFDRVFYNDSGNEVTMELSLHENDPRETA
jgi:CheY-like chemotaxis protein